MKFIAPELYHRQDIWDEELKVLNELPEDEFRQLIHKHISKSLLSLQYDSGGRWVAPSFLWREMNEYFVTEHYTAVNGTVTKQDIAIGYTPRSTNHQHSILNFLIFLELGLSTYEAEPRRFQSLQEIGGFEETFREAKAVLIENVSLIEAKIESPAIGTYRSFAFIREHIKTLRRNSLRGKL